MNKYREVLRKTELWPGVAAAAQKLGPDPEHPVATLDPPGPPVPAAPARHEAARPWVVRSGVGAGSSVPIRTCGGRTPHGAPCKGLAMANGFCRLHGGSRVVKPVRQGLWERIVAFFRRRPAVATR